MNLAKTNVKGFAKLVADEAVHEAEAKNAAGSKTDGKNDDGDDPFGIWATRQKNRKKSHPLLRKRKISSPPDYPPNNMSKEEMELAKLEQSLSSQSKMIPASSGMTLTKSKLSRQPYSRPWHQTQPRRERLLNFISVWQ